MSKALQRTLANVDLGNPVNRAHPLTRGRVAWFLTLPGSWGGAKWRDLMASGRFDGSLTASPTWNIGTRPGGYGHMTFTGANNVDLPALGISGDSPRSAFMWIYSALGTRMELISWGSPFANQQCDLILNLTLSGGLYFTGFGNDIASTVASVTASRWTHIGFTYSGGGVNTTSLKIYVNGLMISTSVAAGAGAALSTADASYGIGYDRPQAPGNPFYYNGKMDDVGIWNVMLPPTQVAALYAASKNGYPGMLNRWSKRTRYVSAFPTAKLLASTGVG